MHELLWQTLPRSPWTDLMIPAYRVIALVCAFVRFFFFSASLSPNGSFCVFLSCSGFLKWYASNGSCHRRLADRWALGKGDASAVAACALSISPAHEPPERRKDTKRSIRGKELEVEEITSQTSKHYMGFVYEIPSQTSPIWKKTHL